MSYNVNFNEQYTVLGLVAPSTVSAGTVTTGMVDMSVTNIGRILFIIDVGVVASSSTVDFEVRAKNAAGSYVAIKNNYPGATTTSKTAIAQVGAGTINKVYFVEVRAESLASQDLTAVVEGILTVGTTSAVVGITVLGTPLYGPATTSTSVGEIVVS